MKWHDLILSDDPGMRYRRHIFFWLAWLIYFSGSFFYKQQSFINDEWILWTILVVFKSTLLLVGHAFICYTVIYFLLPRFLLKGKYFIFTGLLLSAGIIVTGWTYLCYAALFSIVDSVFHSSTAVAHNVLLWNSILAGLLSSLKLVAVAVTIKLLKRWWQKQKENMQLEKEKLNADLQLLKAQIHPDFLFSSLDNIYEYSQTNSAKASESLLKLSDMLSYMLYECDQPFVSLDKEIKMIKDYLELEKKRLGDRLDMDLRVSGNAEGKLISPLLLLPFVENSFQYCQDKNLEKCWINLDIKINEQDFMMKLINGTSTDVESNDSSKDDRITNVERRLGIFYKDGYELKITTEKDFMITFLKIQLDKASNSEGEDVRQLEKSNDRDYLPVYATA